MFQLPRKECDLRLQSPFLQYLRAYLDRHPLHLIVMRILDGVGHQPSLDRHRAEILSIATQDLPFPVHRHLNQGWQIQRKREEEIRYLQ